MKQLLSCIAAGIVTLVLLNSCSRGGDPVDGGGGGGDIHVFVPDDTTAPEISIFTPTAGQIFTNANTINITGRITDDYGLYRGTIRVTNDATGFMLVNQPYEIHGLRLYNFNISHTTSVTSASDYTITVSFEDHGLNFTTKSVKIKVNP